MPETETYRDRVRNNQTQGQKHSQTQKQPETETYRDGVRNNQTQTEAQTRG